MIANPAGRLTVVQKTRRWTIEKQLLPLTATTAFSFTISPAILLQYLLYYNKSILLLPTPP